jgi:hypothetical protein
MRCCDIDEVSKIATYNSIFQAFVGGDFSSSADEARRDLCSTRHTILSGTWGIEGLLTGRHYRYVAAEDVLEDEAAGC